LQRRILEVAQKACGRNKKEWRYHYTRILEAKPIKLRQWQPSKAEIVAVAM
jgi:hypothetical protein